MRDTEPPSGQGWPHDMSDIIRAYQKGATRSVAPVGQQNAGDELAEACGNDGMAALRAAAARDLARPAKPGTGRAAADRQAGTTTGGNQEAGPPRRQPQRQRLPSEPQGELARLIARRWPADRGPDEIRLSSYVNPAGC